MIKKHQLIAVKYGNNSRKKDKDCSQKNKKNMLALLATRKKQVLHWFRSFHKFNFHEDFSLSEDQIKS
jgi:hypothetical protein